MEHLILNATSIVSATAGRTCQAFGKVQTKCLERNGRALGRIRAAMTRTAKQYV